MKASAKAILRTNAPSFIPWPKSTLKSTPRHVRWSCDIIPAIDLIENADVA